jgi:hypothetical protein
MLQYNTISYLMINQPLQTLLPGSHLSWRFYHGWEVHPTFRSVRSAIRIPFELSSLAHLALPTIKRLENMECVFAAHAQRWLTSATMGFLVCHTSSTMNLVRPHLRQLDLLPHYWTGCMAEIPHSGLTNIFMSSMKHLYMVQLGCAGCSRARCKGINSNHHNMPHNHIIIRFRLLLSKLYNLPHHTIWYHMAGIALSGDTSLHDGPFCQI